MDVLPSFAAVQVMRHGVGLSTGSDSELITQLLALTPPMEEQDTPDWVARPVFQQCSINIYFI